MDHIVHKDKHRTEALEDLGVVFDYKPWQMLMLSLGVENNLHFQDLFSCTVYNISILIL